MTTRTWDTTTPADTGFAGDGDDRIRDLKVDLKERLKLDHYMDGELDPLEGDCDGYHRKATLYAQATHPTPLTGTGVIYTKVVDGVTELFFRDATTGTINQLTENGVLSLNTLANDINANGHGITGADIIEADIIEADIIKADQLQSTIATGTAPLIVASLTKVCNLNANLLDGYTAGNANGNIPLSNGIVNTNLNADLLNGKHAGNASGNIPVSNGTINTNLNADLLNGKHAPWGAIVGDIDTQWISGKIYVDPVVSGTLKGGTWDFASLVRTTIHALNKNNNDAYDNNYEDLDNNINYYASGIWKKDSTVIFVHSVKKSVGDPSIIYLEGVNLSTGAVTSLTITNSSSSSDHSGRVVVYNHL